MAEIEMTIEHVICPSCEPETYLCGTPRPAVEFEKVVPWYTPHDETPCAVCFAQRTLACGECGRRVHNAPDPAEDRAVGILILWMVGVLFLMALMFMAIRGGAA